VWSVPLATSAHIKVSRLSESKRIFFSGQEPAYAVKLFFVFKKAFWRVKFCGNAYFSQEFPFTELIEVSPADLSCGILAFFFLADKIKQWEDRFGEGYTTHQIIENKKKYALKVIADMFLEGNIDSPELQDVVMAERSYRHNKYIRSCYQSISKLGTTA
jgi:monoamine oxidase